MGRLIGAFACALVANADYICTTAPDEFASDCQCLTNVEHITGVRTIWSLSPGHEGQGNFKVGVQGHGELLSIGNCSAHWTVSSTPICSHESELVIA